MHLNSRFRLYICTMVQQCQVILFILFRHKNFENRTKIEGVMALTIKISWTACQSQELTRPDVLSPLNILENFYCQGHNSLNFYPIFKILVPKHMSVPRAFIFILWVTTSHVPTCPKTWPKACPSNKKITKIEKRAS